MFSFYLITLTNSKFKEMVHILPHCYPVYALFGMTYAIRVNANTEFGAFKVGTQDNLATALGLACLSESRAEIRIRWLC